MGQTSSCCLSITLYTFQTATNKQNNKAQVLKLKTLLTFLDCLGPALSHGADHLTSQILDSVKCTAGIFSFSPHCMHNFAMCASFMLYCTACILCISMNLTCYFATLQVIEAQKYFCVNWCYFHDYYSSFLFLSELL